MAAIDSTKRLAAFNAVETAVELVLHAPQPFANEMARNLCQVMDEQIWLRSLMPPLFFLVGTDEIRKELARIVGKECWPARISELPVNDWAKEHATLINALVWETEIESQRLALEPPAAQMHATADWVAWTLMHPAYSRSLPHNRSFLREAKFKENLLVLTHETTHILSFLGGVGVCLTALRVTAHENEMTIWSTVGGVEEALRSGRMASVLQEKSVAPLTPGNAGSMWRAERGIELARKSQILQDTWTPWFEGLAIFAEGAADPALDPVGISPVTEVLRNLVDFHPQPGPDGTFADKQEIIRQYAEFAARFEAECSFAIANQGPDRFYAGYVLELEVPYLEGYLAVRSVVAAWRARTARALTATECLTLLLHATRYGVDDCIPDLSLRSDLFEAKARSAMVRWVQRLARLPREAIDDFLTPPESSGPGRPYLWRDGLPSLSQLDDDSVEKIAEVHLRTRIAEAMATLTRPEDAERVATANPLCRTLVEHCDGVLREGQGAEKWQRDIARLTQRATDLIAIGSLFPLGRTMAKFFLNRDPTDEIANLFTHLRTTEDHVEIRRPSINGFEFPVDFDESAKIASHYSVSGEPRMSVTRLIDLGGLASPEGRVGYHFLALRYDNWMHLQGASPAVDTLMREDADRFATLQQCVRARLTPGTALAAELRDIAPGEAGARRTLDWINASSEWMINGDLNLLPLGEWAALLKKGASDVLDPLLQRRSQREAGRLLLDQLFPGQGLGEP